MQTPRMFDPNERVALSLPAHLVNVLMEQLQKSIPVVPYVVYQPLMVELEMQLQKAGTQADKPVTEIASEQLARLRARHGKPNSDAQPEA